MAGQIQRAGLAAIRIVSAKTGAGGVLVGLAENLSVSKTMNVELVPVIGSFLAVAAVYNGEQGQFSWGEAHTFDDFAARGVIPTRNDQDTFGPFTLRVTKRNSTLVLAHIIGGLPNSADIALTAQAHLRTNCSGIAIMTQFGSEMNPPGLE